VERSADGVALDFGELIVGEQGRAVVSARGSSLELETGDASRSSWRSQSLIGWRLVQT
jgi:hypothetical protein